MKKLKHQNVWQVRKNFMAIKPFAGSSKKKDRACTECKKEYSVLLSEGVEMIALMTIKDKPNAHLCNDCADRYINELGAIDIEAQIIEKQKKIDTVLNKIKETGTEIKEDWKNKSVDELETILQGILKEKAKKERLDSIEFTPEELHVEQYLIDEYNVISDPKWLKSEEQIQEFFNEYVGLFDCGQGYYEDEKTVIAKIGLRFFEVHIKAEIGSAKQDVGDRLYWIEDIERITWKEIPKPKIKAKVEKRYSFEFFDNQEQLLNSFLNDNKFKYSVV